jgi:hypothetical protein
LRQRHISIPNLQAQKQDQVLGRLASLSSSSLSSASPGATGGPGDDIPPGGYAADAGSRKEQQSMSFLGATSRTVCASTSAQFVGARKFHWADQQACMTYVRARVRGRCEIWTHAPKASQSQQPDEAVATQGHVLELTEAQLSQQPGMATPKAASARSMMCFLHSSSSALLWKAYKCTCANACSQPMLMGRQPADEFRAASLDCARSSDPRSCCSSCCNSCL